MQPNNSGQRRSSLFGSPLVLPLLPALLLMAALFVALPTPAGATSGAPPAASVDVPMEEQRAAQPAQITDDGNGGGDDDDDGGEDGRRKRDEIVGVVIAGPSGWIGNWQIVVASRTTLTVTVTAETEIDDFDTFPSVGQWVEVRGTQQPDGSVLAKRLRPNEFESGEVIVRLASSEAITDVLDRYDLGKVDTLLASANIYLLAGDDDIQEDNVLQEMARDPAVQWADLNYVSEVPADPEGNPYRTWKWGSNDDSGYVNQTAFQQVNLLPAQSHYSGDGVIVAVLDTGIDAGHPAFAGRLLAGRDMVSDDAVPQDGPEAGEETGLAHGHGTHVSGIITRIAPQSKLLPVRVLDVNGRGNTYVLAYAIEWAVDNGADVINLSLGSEFDSQVLGDAIAAAQARGVVIVAAAGNDGGEIPQYPANFPGVISVTAVDGSDHKADFANFGASWVDLASPGVGITSTVPVSAPVLYAAWSGTSMAAPFAAGAAALVRQQRPTASPAAIAAQLIAAGRNLDTANPAYAGKLGYMLDIASALGVAPANMLYLPLALRQN